MFGFKKGFLLGQTSCEDADKGKGTEAKTLLGDLPTVLIMHILSMLPLKSLLNCTYVSKTWLQIFSDPHFKKLQLSRSSIGILVHSILPVRESRNLLFYQIAEAAHVNQIVGEEMKFTPKFNLPNFEFDPVNSCNGLLCLFGFQQSSFYVCNPVLGEFITIKRPIKKHVKCMSSCLGFSAKTSEYKILLTFNVNQPIKAEVYTIGSGGSWRSLGNALDHIDAKNNCFNTFLDGAFHWVKHSHDEIICFDFEEELFRKVPSPPQNPIHSLGIMENCLCAYCYCSDASNGFDVWVMKDYGSKESWTRQFRIPNMFLSAGSPRAKCNPLIFINGGILMEYNAKMVVCYDLKRKAFTKTNIHAKEDVISLTLTAYTPSFVSLNDIAKGEKISRSKDFRGEPEWWRL